MSPEEMMKMMMTMMSGASNQSMTPQTEVLKWNAVLRPVEGQEQSPFSIAKYAMGDANNQFLLFDINTMSTDLGELESRKNVAAFFFNSPQGQLLKKDIELKLGQLINAETGATISPFSGNVVSLPLSKGGSVMYDIHALKKDGTPMNGRDNLPMISRNATHESTFLTANQIKHMPETITKFQSRIGKETGANKRYRLVIEVPNEQSAADAPPVIN